MGPGEPGGDQADVHLRVFCIGQSWTRVEGAKNVLFSIRKIGGTSSCEFESFLLWPRLDENSNEIWRSKMLCFAIKNLRFLMTTIVNESRLGFKLYMK